MQYRHVPEAHLHAYRDILQYAFEPEAGPEPGEPFEQPECFHRRGLYDVAADTGTDSDADTGTDSDADTAPEASTVHVAAESVRDVSDRSAETLVAVCGSLEFTARLRGDWHRVGGVSAVASPPERRRQGHVATMLAALLSEYREDGVHFSLLYPFKYSFYRRLGWARVHRYTRTELPPDALSSVAADPAGRFQRLEADDLDELTPVLEAAQTHPLAIERTESWWRRRVFTGWHTDPYVYGWRDDRGDLRGYLVYRVEEANDGKTLRVTELVAPDYETRTQLYRFLRDHDSQVDAVRFPGPVDTELLDTLADPRAADVELVPGAMLRVVDVAAALERLAYPVDAAVTVAVAVADEQCPWNDDTFELAVADGRATCQPTDVASDAALDVGGLSQLAVGAQSATELERHGDLTAQDPDAVAALDAAFPRTDPYVREWF